MTSLQHYCRDYEQQRQPSWLKSDGGLKKKIEEYEQDKKADSKVK